jgi:UDP-N-acetylmuramoyl-L-alanyl-D-glutamate--2,6-diaminopimelate ligase
MTGDTVILEGTERGLSSPITCIGVTGSDGKTTVSHLLRSMLEASGNKVGLMTAAHFGGLHEQLRRLMDSGASHAVIEISSHALVQRRLQGIDFKVAIFTNLSLEYLDNYKDLDAYREAMGVLFSGLSPEAFAVLNAEDSASQYLAKQTRAKTLWYYAKATKGIRGEIVSTSFEGTELMLSDGQEELLVRSPLIGMHNFCNLLAAATAARALDVGLSEIKQGIESLDCLPGRLERIPGRGFQVFIDYANTPHALEAVLATLRPLVENRLLLVLGCGGDRGKRPLMTQIAGRYSDIFWLTGYNPRSEPPTQILRDVEDGVNGKCYRVEPDRCQAIEQALSCATGGDVVLIAGKGYG